MTALLQPLTAPLGGRAARAFKLQAYLKFAATVDNDGVPNVVPLLSARMVSPHELAFVKFMVWKTRKNFEQNGKICIGCIGPWGRSYLAKGEFCQWLSKGPLLEQFESEPLFRYNAYMGANLIGLIRVKETLELPRSAIVGPFIEGLGLGGPRRWADVVARKKPRAVAAGPMPVQTLEKWGRAVAAKFIGMVDDQGDPLAIPVQGLRAPAADALVFPRPASSQHPLVRLRRGDPIAAAVFVPDPNAYQVKGRFAGYVPAGHGHLGAIAVDQVFAASPPLPGKRIFPPEP